MPCQLNHRLDGPPDAPVLVLSGSLGTVLSMWDPHAATLGERFRVLRYDLRGHGGSAVPPGPYAMSELGEDLLALMDEVGIERAALCGLSIGGMISMWVAAHHPDRVQRLVACCTSAKLGPPEVWHERVAAVRAGGIESIADAVLERWFTPAFAEAHPELIARMRAQLVATPPEGYIGCCEAIAAMDLTGDLPQITAPTLVLAAEQDLATPPEHGRQIAELIPGARFQTVSPGAHIATVERPDVTTAMILRFLSDEEARE